LKLLHTVKAVLWAFFGVRRRSGYEEDLGRLSPFAVIGVALALVLCFIGGLVALVNWVA
jgi:hypothetical protein